MLNEVEIRIKVAIGVKIKEDQILNQVSSSIVAITLPPKVIMMGNRRWGDYMQHFCKVVNDRVLSKYVWCVKKRAYYKGQ